jgi:hypothetical protein
MAGNIFQNYGTADQSITITLNSLGSASQRQSTYVANTGTYPYADALIQVAIVEASGASGTGYADVYAYGSSYGTSNFTDVCTGSDAAFAGNLANLVKLGRINFTAASQTKIGGPWSLAMAFGGTAPQYWGIVVDNETGAALASSGCSAWYQGAFGQYS